MSLLSENMRLLRVRSGLSQQFVADKLLITRSRYAKYEDGVREPPIEVLVRISRFFYVSIDLLVSTDLSRISLQDLQQLPDNRILLPVTVDAEGVNKIEIIPHKAQMGYLTGYADPEYIEKLTSLSLPFLTNAKYRAFPVTGDSMPPYREDCYIVGGYVEKLTDLKPGKTYIFITRQEGITYKRLAKINKTSLTVAADNPLYAPYDIDLVDLMEVWKFAASIATREHEPDDLSAQTIRDMFTQIKSELIKLKRA